MEKIRSIKEAQNWVWKTWEKSPKKGVTEKDELIFLLQEIGEVAKELAGLNGMRKNKSSLGNLEKEFGDVFLSLLTLANRYHIDLEKGFAKTVISIEKRYMKR